MDKIRLSAVTLFLCLALPISSYAIPVEPDDFAAGTDISSLFPGVTLSEVRQDSSTHPVLSLEEVGLASTGTRVFGFVDETNGPRTAWGDGTPWNYLRVDFSPLALDVSLDFIANDPKTSDENAVLAAYDASDNLLAFDRSPAPLTNGQFVTLTVSSPDIAFVVDLGDPLGDLNSIQSVTTSGGGRHDWVLDNLNYSPIPEPSTLLLLGSGLIGLIGFKRKFSVLN